MKNFIKNHISEIYNVTWPTRKQSIHSMITVLSIMFIVGLILAGLDNSLSQLVTDFLT